MPCAVVILVFQHNPKEHFRGMPLQNDDIHIYRLQRESAGKVMWISEEYLRLEN